MTERKQQRLKAAYRPQFTSTEHLVAQKPQSQDVLPFVIPFQTEPLANHAQFYPDARRMLLNAINDAVLFAEQQMQCNLRQLQIAFEKFEFTYRDQRGIHKEIALLGTILVEPVGEGW